jgi:hypothetical protein
MEKFEIWKTSSRKVMDTLLEPTRMYAYCVIVYNVGGFRVKNLATFIRRLIGISKKLLFTLSNFIVNI